MGPSQGWHAVNNSHQTNKNIAYTSCSTAVTYEHLPWLSYYTRNFPVLISTLARLRQTAYERTVQRYNHGSTVKDLFYYLVRGDIGTEMSMS